MNPKNTIIFIAIVYIAMAFIELEINPILWGWWVRGIFAGLMLFVLTPLLAKFKKEVYVVQHPTGKVLAIFKKKELAQKFTSQEKTLITSKIKLR